MQQSNDYGRLDENGNVQEPKKRGIWFWVAVAIVVGCIIGVIVFVIVDATSDNGGSGGSSGGSNNNNNNDDGYVLETSLGSIRGNVLQQSSNNTVYEFVGVRYAESPTGDMRFKPAVMANSTWNATYDATSYGATCPQYITSTVASILYGEIGEDCLFLNIWTPIVPGYDATMDADWNATKELLPVMLFIHGGSFVSGAGRVYNGTQIIIEGEYNVVYVSINYRLGFLGFLQMEELYEENSKIGYPSYGGMNGIYDQLQAIRFVKQIISSFGGDPSRITVFGESAGGLSICNLMVTDLINQHDDIDDDLIYQAIIESGPCAGPWSELNLTYGLGLTQLVLESGTDLGNIFNLTKLRELSYQDILAYVQNSSLTNGGWSPSVDGYVVTAPTSKLYATKEKINAQRLIWGFNSQDGLAGWPYYGGSHPKNSSEYYTFLMGYINNETIVNELMNVYYPISEFENNASIAWFGINSDLCIACPTFEMADGLRNKYEDEGDSNFKQYIYEFEGAYQPFLAPHAGELPFVFDWGAQFAAYYRLTWNESLSEAMIRAWNAYAQLEGDDKFIFETYNYNGADVLFMEWMDYGVDDTNNRSVLIFSNTIKREKNYRQTYRHGACRYWENNVAHYTRTQICIGGY